MKKLFLSQPYRVKKIAVVLGFNTKLKNGIRINFGDPVSINELKLITKKDFLACRNLGKKSWRQFQEGLSAFYSSDSVVTFIGQPNVNSVIVEINTSKPFGEVIQGLAEMCRD